MRGYYRSGWGALGALLVVRTASAQAALPREVPETPPVQMTQMTMPMSATPMPPAPLGIDDARNGSGTSWLPDDSPMRGAMWDAGPWSLMLHGAGFLQYIQTTGARGDHEVGSVNWFMGMAERAVAGGPLTFRGMLSLEPLTVGRCGYPDLLQTGELCLGSPLHDAQHPHNLFMELAADYRHALTSSLAIEIYGGPAGEPALGPVAFPHRPSATGSPTAPVSHHWLDSTHVSFGVVTAGAYGRRWKAEASVFNGREPDDRRYRLELAPLDSYSGRVWWLPSPQWSVQVSAGHLKDAEARPAGPREDVARITASATYHRLSLGPERRGRAGLVRPSRGDDRRDVGSRCLVRPRGSRGQDVDRAGRTAAARRRVRRLEGGSRLHAVGERGDRSEVWIGREPGDLPAAGEFVGDVRSPVAGRVHRLPGHPSEVTALLVT
jgi:hypothetical protein